MVFWRAAPVRVSEAGVVWGVTFDCATFMDRGLNVLSSSTYLAGAPEGVREEDALWRLLRCERGADGAHLQGTAMGREVVGGGGSGGGGGRWLKGLGAARWQEANSRGHGVAEL